MHFLPLRRFLRIRLIPLVLLAAAACQPPDSGLPTDPTDSPTALMASMSSSVPAGCNSETLYKFYRGCWSTGQTIRLQPVSSSFSDDLNAAVDDWNEYLAQDASAPRFAVAAAGQPFDVHVTAVESGSAYCGEFSIGSLDSIRILSMSGTCNSNAHNGSWGAAMRQEMAGIIGWSEAVEGAGSAQFEPGFTTLCVLHLVKPAELPDRKINEQVCVHEAEGVILAYRGLDHTVGFDRMFRDTVYMHVTVKNAPSTLPVGQSVQLVADTFYSGGFGTGGMPAMQAASGHIPVAKPTTGAVEWRTTALTLVSHVGGGVFQGVAQGTAYAAARPSGSPSTYTRWWLPFKERGDSVALVVPAPPPPPPPPPFQVDSIGTDQMPITVATYHTFTARVVSQPSGSLSTRWIVTDSRTPSQSDTITVSGNTLSRFIEQGSYAISFTVRPVAGGTTGLAATQDIPVCATPSENLWGGTKQGGGSTNATPGCENYQ